MPIRIYMRWIGPSLLVLALVFSTGGVAIVGQAGSTADAKSSAGQSTTPADSPTQPDPSACEAQPGFRPRAPAQPRVLKDAAGNKSIVLNTSGYNYLLEGEWRPDPVAKPQNVPDGVLPNPQDAAPPAAPETK